MRWTLRIGIGDDHLATLAWEDGALTAPFVAAPYRDLVDRWLEEGLAHLDHGEDGLVGPVHVSADDPDVLPAIDRFMRKFFPRHWTDLRAG